VREPLGLYTAAMLHKVFSAVMAGLVVSVAAARQPDAVKPGAEAEAIGSTRNAKVAYAMGGERAPLTFLAGRLTEKEKDELREVALNVTILSGLTPEAALELASKANGVDARFATPEFIKQASNLVWVQAMSAGVDSLQRNRPLMDSDRIVLTNMRAVHGPAIADHAMGMLLTLTRQLRQYEAGQKAGKWREEELEERPVALAGKTMLIVGIGGIGTEIAQRASGFGMRVIATRRTDAPAPAYVERVGKPEDLMEMLPEADVVAVCVPLTDETRGLFGRAAFAAMKHGSYLVNIARGKIVETAALVEALKSGTLAGACLDVTDPEPLPDEHPLWSMKNVVITPHVAAESDLTDERRWTLLKENIRRFGGGEPLLNCVDKQRGY